MSTFKEIIDTISGLEGELTSYILSGKKHKSISKSAQDSILNFPVIVSDTLSLEDAGLVSKALEREFATFVLTVTTMNPYLYTHGNPSAQKYLHKLHQNIDTRGDFTDVQNAVTNLVSESMSKLGIDYEPLSEDITNIAYYIYEGVNHQGVNSKNIRCNYSIAEIANPNILNDMVCRPIVVREASFDNTHGRMDNIGRVFANDGDVDASQDIDIRRADVNIDGGALGRALGRSMSNGGGGSRHGMTRDAKFLMDNDVKKSNELVPTLIHIRIFPVDATDPEVNLEPIDLIIGIKATLHPVSTDELLINIARGIKNDDKVFNFIRWTTGEIKFFRDFVFAVNDLKIDAINTSAKTSKWWTMLKRRKALSRIKNVILPDRLLPNATIVMTQEEIDMLRDQYGYDLNNEHLVYKLMNAYFLIAFVIVDPALQRVKFLFDGKTEYETLTYATLAREATTNDKQFKEMLNMLGRRI